MFCVQSKSSCGCKIITGTLISEMLKNMRAFPIMRMCLSEGYSSMQRRWRARFQIHNVALPVSSIKVVPIKLKTFCKDPAKPHRCLHQDPQYYYSRTPRNFDRLAAYSQKGNIYFLHLKTEFLKKLK